MSGEGVPDITPPAMVECPLIDAVEENRKEARMAAWAGVIVAVLGVLSWSTYGFLACGLGAIALGLYARRFAPIEALADFVAGCMLLVVLGLRLAGLL